MLSSTLPLAAVAAVALLLAACDSRPVAHTAGVAGAAAPTSNFTAWDTNGDGRLTEAEFTAAARGGVYERWNTTADAGLDGDEIAAGLFRLGDRDRNHQLAGDEKWVTEQGPSNRPGLEYGGIDVSEADRDGSLTLDEVKAWVGRAAVVRTWDTDRNGVVDSSELGHGMVALLDTNRDGVVDAGEWRSKVGDAGWT